jgi:hypothetical protein
MEKRKIGRNDPCPCGSGLKYKKCHGKSKTGIEEDIQKSYHKEKIREAKYGSVRPIISTDFHGYKIVASGNHLNYSKKWKTFHDFLFDYLRTTLGNEWGAAELKKDPAERHPVIQWYISLCKYQKEHIKEPGKIHSGICTGTVAAYLSLSYDLYLLRHHTLLQERLIHRLKIKDQFQGARYEIYVIASFIKANFDIVYEDETDRSRSHCEFIATHKPTGKIYAVEAKSRHRPGLLGRPGRPQKSDEIRLRVGRLLRSALAKDTSNERIVFIDVNMPPQDVGPLTTIWFKPFMEEVIKLERDTINGKEVPPAYLMMTNHPYHYAGDEQPDPRKHFHLTAINRPEFMRKPNGSVGPIDTVVLSLWESINKHTVVPHEFDNG